MIVAFTGHRPDKLGGYHLPNPTYNYVCQQIEIILKQERPEKIISGMALGVDQWAAFVAYKLKIPFVAAIPFKGQESKWPHKSKNTYYKLLQRASEIVIVSDGPYKAAKLQIRNCWMVDNCDKLVAVWDGTDGGTANCVTYAKQVEREIIRINPVLTDNLKNLG